MATDRERIAELGAKLDELMLLDDGWDGHGAKAIYLEAAAYVRRLLPTMVGMTPNVWMVATAEGGILLMWDTFGGIVCELVVGQDVCV